MEFGESHQIGSVINKATKLAVLGDKEKRKELFKPLAAQFWEALLQGTSENIKEFNNIMNFLLLSNKKDKDIDNAIRFISFVISGLLAAEANKCYDFANGFLINIAGRSGCTEKAARVRCCQFIRMILSELSEDFEIDANVAEIVQKALLERVKDMYTEVRVQSIYALERFTSPGPNEDFSDDEVTNAYYHVIYNDLSCMVRAAALNCLPVTKKFYDALVKKTSDISEIVRANSYKLFQKKINPRNLSTEDMHNIVQNGLNDSSETVNSMTQTMLISWLKNQYNNDFISFLTLFDIKLSYNIISDIIGVFMERNDKTSILKYIGKTDGLRSANLDNMTICIFWKAICLKVKQEADNCTRRAAEATAIEAERLTNESEALLDLLESILPESIVSFIEKIKYQIFHNRLQHAFELMIIIQNCISFGDTGERKIIAEFIKESFLYASEIQNSTLQTDYIEHLSALGWMVWSDPGEFSETICTILLEIKSNSDFTVKERNSDSTQLMTWSLIVREMLRLMPNNIHNIQTLGCVNFSFIDLLKTLVSIYHQYKDDETLSITIENLGLYSLLELSPSVSGMILPLVTRSLNIESGRVRIMAVRVLCSLSLSYGIRNIESHRQNFEIEDFKPLWQFKYEIKDGLVSYILKMLSLDDEKEDYELELEIIESLCKLLIFNRFQKSKGLSCSESVRILVVFLTYLANYENANLKKIQQILLVFFQSFMQMHIINQKYLQLAFIPAIYASFKVSRNHHIDHVISTITNLSNFLKIQPNMKLNINTSSNTDNGIGQCQLACIILWELANCPGEHLIKSYVNALWKALLSLDFSRDSVTDIQNLYRLLKIAKNDYGLHAKEFETFEQNLKNQLIIDEEQGEDFSEDDSFREMKTGLNVLFIQYGKHPLHSIAK